MLFRFQHPGVTSCTEPGDCGFIIKGRVSAEDGNATALLSTDLEDYTDTTIHYHDIISADKMFWYSAESGSTADGQEISVTGNFAEWWTYWLPEIEEWSEGKCYVAYDLSGYLVAG